MPKQIFSKDYYKICSLAEEYIEQKILHLFLKLEILPLFENQISIAWLVQHNFIAKGSSYAFEWFLNYLSYRGLISIKFLEGNVSFKQSQKFEIKEIGSISNSMIKIEPNIRNFLNLTDYAFDGYPEYLKGKDGFKILFSREGIKYWERYFSNENPGYSVYNRMNTRAVLDYTNRSSNVSLLELGGGVGSAFYNFIDEARNFKCIQKIGTFNFSDISLSLLRQVKKSYELDFRQESGLDVNFCMVDFNDFFERQGFLPESISIIYGVNSIHVSRDIPFTLKQIYRTLKKSGRLIITESVRSETNPCPFQEAIFNLLPDFINIKLDYVRKHPGFLTLQGWMTYFKDAGFKNIKYYSNVGLSDEFVVNPPLLSITLMGDK